MEKMKKDIKEEEKLARQTKEVKGMKFINFN